MSEVYRELTLSHQFWRVLYCDGTIKTLRVKKTDYIRDYIRDPTSSTYKRMILTEY